VRQYFLIKVSYKNREAFLIWYCNNKEGVLLHKQRLLMFESVSEAKLFAEKKGISLDMEVAEYNLSAITELIDRVGLTESCNELLNAWNLFSDIANSLGEEFSGDSDEELTSDIYHMLFHGCNILSEAYGEFHPIFDDKEKERCLSVLNNGLAILDKQMHA